MSELERLVMLAEDQLTEYSTDARKIEKLRQKIGLSVPYSQQRQIKETLIAEMPTDPISNLIAAQRQAVALPFWGIAGLGLLLGISFMQPLDLLATAVGGTIAIAIQRRGWKLEAKKLLIRTLEDIETRAQSAAQQ
jgi:hypothetical protein